jgi:ankyrin repeat protein
VLFFLPANDEDRALEVVELLLAYGADPGGVNADGETAAEAAAKQGMDAVAELLRDGAD